jgi:hypothetical protein
MLSGQVQLPNQLPLLILCPGELWIEDMSTLVFCSLVYCSEVGGNFRIREYIGGVIFIGTLGGEDGTILCDGISLVGNDSKTCDALSNSEFGGEDVFE